MTQDEFNEMLEIGLSTMTASVDDNDIEVIQSVDDIGDNTTIPVVKRVNGHAVRYQQVTLAMLAQKIKAMIQES